MASDNTIDIDSIVVKYADKLLQLDRAHPDVGMGMFPFMAIDRAIEDLGLEHATLDKDRLNARLIERCRASRM